MGSYNNKTIKNKQNNKRRDDNSGNNRDVNWWHTNGIF